MKKENNDQLWRSRRRWRIINYEKEELSTTKKKKETLSSITKRRIINYEEELSVMKNTDCQLWRRKILIKYEEKAEDELSAMKKKRKKKYQLWRRRRWIINYKKEGENCQLWKIWIINYEKEDELSTM